MTNKEIIKYLREVCCNDYEACTQKQVLALEKAVEIISDLPEVSYPNPVTADIHMTNSEASVILKQQSQLAEIMLSYFPDNHHIAECIKAIDLATQALTYTDKHSELYVKIMLKYKCPDFDSFIKKINEIIEEV